MSSRGRRAIAVTFNEESRLPPYERALAAVGLHAVRNPDSMDGLDGLLLTGGVDVDPKLYGELPHPKTDAPVPERDHREIRLLEQALALDLPVLAICRGLQLWNVAAGGTLVQDLPPHPPHQRRTPEDPSLTVHAVRIEPQSSLAGILGAGPYPVNSRHHQAVARLAPGLAVSACSEPDGLIEAMERPGRRFAIAVQWHAEDLLQKDPRLFQAFSSSIV